MSNEINISRTKFSIKSSNSQLSNGSYNNHYMNKIKGTNGNAYGNVKKDDLNKERQKQLDTIMEKFNKDDEKHKKLMLENKQRRKKVELKLKEENIKKNEKEQEILKNLKLNRESAYISYLKNNTNRLFPKMSSNIPKKQREKTPKNIPKPSSKNIAKQNKENENVFSRNNKNDNLEALDLEIRQSAENLNQILKKYKKEDQDSYGKVVDDFVSILENEINQSEQKSPFLESLDLSQRQDLKNTQTFGGKKLDFYDKIEKCHENEDKKTLEEIIGYISDDSSTKENYYNSKKKEKNNNSKPFTAETIKRENVEDYIPKALKTENNMEKNKICFKNVKSQNKVLNYKEESAVSNVSHNNKKDEVPKIEKKKNSFERPRKEFEENNSKFKNKLLGNIAVSREILSHEIPKRQTSKSKERVQVQKNKKDDHLIVTFFKFSFKNFIVKKEAVKLNNEEATLQNELMEIEAQYKAYKNKLEKPKDVIKEEDLEESLQKINVILKTKTVKGQTNSNVIIPPKEINEKSNDRYKDCDISKKYDETHHEENEFIIEEEEENKNKSVSEQQVFEKSEFQDEKKLGYYALKNQKKIQENEIKTNETQGKSYLTKENFEEEGRIKIVNKENLRKLFE